MNAKMHRRNPSLAQKSLLHSSSSLPSMGTSPKSTSPPAFPPLKTTPSGHYTLASSLIPKWAIPRRRRPRTSFLVAVAGLTFLALSSYFLFNHTSTQPQPEHESVESTRARLLTQTVTKQEVAFEDTRPQLQWSNENEELGALLAFLTSAPPGQHNVLPTSINPSFPIDPQLVLGFDTRTDPSLAQSELSLVLDHVRSTFPVVMFVERHRPLSRELQRIINALDLAPPPMVVEMDDRSDRTVLEPLLRRLANATEYAPTEPLLLVGGKRVGPLSTIRELGASNKLLPIIVDAGARPSSSKRRKHRKH